MLASPSVLVTAIIERTRLGCSGLLAPSPSVDPAHEPLNWDDHQRALNIVGHRDIDRVARSKIDPLQELRWDGDLAVCADLERAMRRVHHERLQNLVDFVVMDLQDPLAALLDEAERLPKDDRAWLLTASELSETINRAVLCDPLQLEAVRIAVQDAAAEAGCDLVVGASEAADGVVRCLNTQTTAAPKRVLLFDLVRITGAAFAQAAAELRHVDVVPAVLIDLHPSLTTSCRPRSIVVREVARS